MDYRDDSVPTTYLEPTNDIDMNFGLLPEPEGRNRAFLTSALSNVVIFGILMLLTIAALKHKQIQEFVATPLVLPENTPPPPKPKPPPVPKVKVPPEIVKPEPPKIVRPPEPPKPVLVKMEQPKMPNIPSAPPKAIPPPPPPPKVGLFTTTATPTATANNNKPPTIKTGGFGDPLGAKPNPNARASAAAMPSVGGFDQPKGEGIGAGRAGKGSVKGVDFGTGVPGGVPGGTGHGKIGVAGFSNGVPGGTGTGTGTGHGPPSSAGFGNNIAAVGPRAAPVDNSPQTTQIEVLSKPDVKQFYTAEARSMHIEGEVLLKIRVDRDGHAEVLGVVRGLGHGLDEAAVRALGQTRFKPAYANGQPVDKVTIYHVLFQLA
jgi:TonB family protein